MTSDNLFAGMLIGAIFGFAAIALVIHVCLPKREQVTSEEKFMETLRKTGF